MALSKGWSDIFARLDWDAPSVGVFMWLLNEQGAAEGISTSLAHIEKSVGLGRVKLHKVLSRLKKNKIIKIVITAKSGVTISVLPHPYVKTNLVSLSWAGIYVENKTDISRNYGFTSDLTTSKFPGIYFLSSPSLSPSSLAPSFDASVNDCNNKLTSLPEASDIACSNEVIPLQCKLGSNNIHTRARISEEEMSKEKKASPRKKITHQAELLDYTDEELKLATDWFTFATSMMKWTTPPKAWSIPRFAFDLRKVSKAVGLDQNGLRAVLRFVEGHHFWSKNALSPAGLLDRSPRNELRKIDTILLQMKPSNFRTREQVHGMTREEEQAELDRWRV